MYNRSVISDLVQTIERENGKKDKNELSKLVQQKFSLITDRKVYFCSDFAIRFSKSEKIRMSNTVLSLSALQKYDNIPFIVCIVSSKKNHLLLANTSFLKKISHSSQELRIDNIRGSFNGTDIITDFEGIQNIPENFETLFNFHIGFSFQENLERLVENTNGIVGRDNRFLITEKNSKTILNSINRAKEFIVSDDYKDLKNDLDNRTKNVQGEIAIAAFIDNVNIRGRIIEYLITDNGTSLKNQIIAALRDKTPLPSFKTKDDLGDYSKEYSYFNTETDIKTKVLFLDGNPKGYNIDKFLSFLSNEKSVYLIYLLGIEDNGTIISRLCSVFDNRLLSGTHIIHHWSGRNSRGVTQFNGTVLKEILKNEGNNEIDYFIATDYLNEVMNR